MQKLEEEESKDAAGLYQNTVPSPGPADAASPFPTILALVPTVKIENPYSSMLSPKAKAGNKIDIIMINPTSLLLSIIDPS